MAHKLVQVGPGAHTLQSEHQYTIKNQKKKLVHTHTFYLHKSGLNLTYVDLFFSNVLCWNWKIIKVFLSQSERVVSFCKNNMDDLLYYITNGT